MLVRIKIHPAKGALNSYLGLMSHGNTYKLKEEVLDIFYLSSK